MTDLEAGSPAHAGIDLGLVNQRLPLRGFPRTRGDRPFVHLQDHRCTTVPPHTRG